MQPALGSEDEVNSSQLFSQQDNAIQLPPSLFETIATADNVGLFFAFYNMSTLFPVDGGYIDKSAPRQTQVGSPVIASTVGGENFTFDNLFEPVMVSLTPDWNLGVSLSLIHI